MPGRTGTLSPHDAVAGAGVEVRGAGGFQFGLAAGLERQPAEAVGHQQDDLGVRRFAEFADQVVDVHAGEFTARRSMTYSIGGPDRRCGAAVDRPPRDRDHRCNCPTRTSSTSYQRLLAPPPEAWTPLAELQAPALPAAGAARGGQAAADAGPQPGRRRARAAATRRRSCSRSRPGSSTCRRRLLDQLPPQAGRQRAGPGDPAWRNRLRENVRPRRRPRHRRLLPRGQGALRRPVPHLPQRAAGRSCGWASRGSTSRATTSTTTRCRTCSSCWRSPASIPSCARSAGASIVVSKSGGTLETAAAYRAFRARGGRVLRPEVAEMLKQAGRAGHRADGQAPRPVPGRRLHRRRHPDHPRRRRRPVQRVHAGRACCRRRSWAWTCGRCCSGRRR